MKKINNQGKVAVLYSPGFGAGWYSWNTENPNILFDPNIVEFVEKGEIEKCKAYVELKYPEIYTGGLEDLRIAWITEGTLFRIHEYDGNESIEVKEEMDWLIA